MALPDLDSLVPPIIMLPTPDKTADKLVKDRKVPASTLIRDHTGWRGQDARIARGVMGAESGFNAGAVNNAAKCSDKGDVAVGLMQVCTIHKGSYGIPANLDRAIDWLKDPINNVEAAYRVWSVQGWDAWEMFTNQRYKAFMNQNPLITLEKRSATTAVQDAADAALGPVDEIAGALLNPSTWLRVGKGALGGTLLLVGVGGLVFLAANKAAKSGAGRAAMRVTPAGSLIRKVT